jgi:hypothetical protein
MNERDIEHMWKVASNNPNHDTNWHDPVVIAFAELIRADEREAVEDLLKEYDMVNSAFAKDFRARGNT